MKKKGRRKGDTMEEEGETRGRGKHKGDKCERGHRPEVRGGRQLQAKASQVCGKIREEEQN
jgi:hypothetical protein